MSSGSNHLLTTPSGNRDVTQETTSELRELLRTATEKGCIDSYSIEPDMVRLAFSGKLVIMDPQKTIRLLLTLLCADDSFHRFEQRLQDFDLNTGSSFD